MGCSSSSSNTGSSTAADKRTLEAQRKAAKKAEEDALEMELQRLMHERQVKLAGQARPLLESRSSLRDFNSTDAQSAEVDEETLKKRAQVRQAIALREAAADNKWMVGFKFYLLHE